MYKLIALDLDGTLINSEKKFYESFRKTLYNKYNIEITETIQKTIEVEADNEQAALHIAMKKYKNSEEF